MQSQGAGLLGQIEQDVLDEDKPFSAALRRCMLLGSRTGSSQLREWATLELKGYPVRGEVPEYRVVHAGLHIDGVVPGGVIKGQPIGTRSLPDFVAGTEANGSNSPRRWMNSKLLLSSTRNRANS